jgi:hypothetical protein
MAGMFSGRHPGRRSSGSAESAVVRKGALSRAEEDRLHDNMTELLQIAFEQLAGQPAEGRSRDSHATSPKTVHDRRRLARLIRNPRFRELLHQIEAGLADDANDVEHAAPAVPVATEGAADPGLQEATARGEAAKLEWIRSGLVVPAAQLAQAWGLTPQALGPAAERGELVSIKIKGKRYYPTPFTELDRESVLTITRLLSPLPASEQFIFWMRPHGALGGQTAAQCLAANPAQLARVCQLAHAWVQEAALPDAAA